MTISGAIASHLRPLGGARLLARLAERVLAAGQLDHLRDPVPADVDRVQPLERSHARARRVLDRALDRLEAVAELRHELLAGLA